MFQAVVPREAGQQHTLNTSIHSCSNQDVYSNGPNMLCIFNFYNDLMSGMVSWLPGWKAPGSNGLRVSRTFTVIHYERCLWHCIFQYFKYYIENVIQLDLYHSMYILYPIFVKDKGICQSSKLQANWNWF